MDVEQGRKEINALGYFNTQASSSLATAELQNSIKAMAVDAGGELSCNWTLPESPLYSRSALLYAFSYYAF
jgi:general secretion pathway protein M